MFPVPGKSKVQDQNVRGYCGPLWLWPLKPKFLLMQPFASFHHQTLICTGDFPSLVPALGRHAPCSGESVGGAEGLSQVNENTAVVPGPVVHPSNGICVRMMGQKSLASSVQPQKTTCSGTFPLLKSPEYSRHHPLFGGVQNDSLGDFPGGTVAKTPGSQCRKPRFNSWAGNYIPDASTKSTHAANKTQHTQINK